MSGIIWRAPIQNSPHRSVSHQLRWSDPVKRISGPITHDVARLDGIADARDDVMARSVVGTISRVGGSAIGVRVLALLGFSVRTSAGVDGRVLVVVTDAKTKAAWINAPMACGGYQLSNVRLPGAGNSPQIRRAPKMGLAMKSSTP